MQGWTEQNQRNYTQVTVGDRQGKSKQYDRTIEIWLFSIHSFIKTFTLNRAVVVIVYGWGLLFIRLSIIDKVYCFSQDWFEIKIENNKVV